MKRDIGIILVAVIAFGALALYVNRKSESPPDTRSLNEIAFEGFERPQSVTESFYGRVSSIESKTNGLEIVMEITQQIITQEDGNETQIQQYIFIVQPDIPVYSIGTGEVVEVSGVPFSGLHRAVEQPAQTTDIKEGDILTVRAFAVTDTVWNAEHIVIEFAE